MVRIAVSTEGSQVSSHFGRCSEYTIVDAEDGKVVKKETIGNPSHEPGFLPKYLLDMGVTHIIAGGMGPRAQDLFSQYNIKTIIGVSGQVDRVIEDFLNGTITIGESQCDHDSPSHKKCHE